MTPKEHRDQATIDRIFTAFLRSSQIDPNSSPEITQFWRERAELAVAVASSDEALIEEVFTRFLAARPSIPAAAIIETERRLKSHLTKEEEEAVRAAVQATIEILTALMQESMIREAQGPEDT